MATKELVLGPLIGSLAHNSVKLWGRASRAATLHAWLDDGKQVTPAGKTKVGAKTGFTGVVEIQGLQPETGYGYALTISDEQPPAASFGRFKTAPPPGQLKNFSFAFGSCFLPCQDEPGLTFQRIERMHGSASFLLMIGDQIYADQWKHNGLEDYIALDKNDYNEVYLHTWSNPYMRELLKKLPVFMTLDDHEVDDDWHWTDLNRTQAAIPLYERFGRWLKGHPRKERQLTHERVRTALQSYWEHQGMHAPELLIPETVKMDQVQLEPGEPFSFAYAFNFGGAAFFVMDTRSMRMRRRGRNDVLGNEQWLKLKSWLSKVKDEYPVKFVVTSSAFLHFLIGDFALDRWSAYPRERDRLLYYIQEHEIEGVYLLTGDLHSGHAISVNVKGRKGKDIPLWEFCASPFEQKPNWLAWLLTLRWMPHRLWEKYKVHFVKGKINYGVVKVNFDQKGGARVGFELHYVEKDGKWKVSKAGN